ncbi:death domain-containing protein CRADD-like [Asterias amurensis]|uniref:death domain-containing protein CRADD-like n=1 Tax=Asterias amurensis TaxID=7602 RepID=UPI003AB20BCF
MDTGMTVKHCEVLAKCRVRFVKDLNPDDVLDHLIADLIITPDDQEDIAARTTRKEKVRFILDLLPQRSDRAFYSLKEALNDADSGHRHLYELLDKTLDDVSLPCPVQATDSKVPMELDPPLDPPLAQSSTRAGHDVAERLRNGPVNPDEPVTEQQLATLAGKIGKEWEFLGAKLGMNDNDMYKFKMENQYNAWAQIQAMLIKWRNREYKKATIGVLIEKCKEADIGRDSYEFLINP